MRTSELADRVGVNPETLRHYDRRGLLDRVLRFVKRAQDLGFTLDEVEELLHLDAGGPDRCDAARALAVARQSDLQARIADLQRMRHSLADLVGTCDLPRADRTCPLLDAVAHASIEGKV